MADYAVLSLLLDANPKVMLAVWNRHYQCWGMPGGKVEEGESLEQAHIRELYEETGLTVHGMPKIIYTAPTYSGSGRICKVFYVEQWSGDLTPREVGTGVGWMPLEVMAYNPISGPWFREFFWKMRLL